MNHDTAIAIFKDLQRRPYRVSVAPDVPADNCFYKGMELLQRLGRFGYAVRGRVCETFWDPAVFPAKIIALHPADVLTTHFFVEAEIDGRWRILDPSFHPGMAEHGALIGDFFGTPAPCFPVTKLYTHEENIRYQSLWNDPEYARTYFRHCGPFLHRLNEWLAEHVSGI